MGGRLAHAFWACSGSLSHARAGTQKKCGFLCASSPTKCRQKWANFLIGNSSINLAIFWKQYLSQNLYDRRLEFIRNGRRNNPRNSKGDVRENLQMVATSNYPV